MDYASFHLSPAISVMLLDDSPNGNDEQLVETFDNIDFQAKLSAVKMSNLVEVLTKEGMNHQTGRGGLQLEEFKVFWLPHYVKLTKRRATYEMPLKICW